MTQKFIAISTLVGVLIMLVVAAMAWQVTPALAGFTPQPTNPPSIETQPPPPVRTPPAPRHTPPGDTPGLDKTPELPVTGGQLDGPDNTGFLVLLAAVTAFLLAAITLVIRQSARTKTEK